MGTNEGNVMRKMEGKIGPEELGSSEQLCLSPSLLLALSLSLSPSSTSVSSHSSPLLLYPSLPPSLSCTELQLMRGSPGSGFTAVYRREGRLFQYDALKDGAPGETRLPGVWLCIRLLLVLGRICLVVCGVVQTGFSDRYPSCWQSCQERCVMASVCFLMPFLAVYFLVFVLLSVPPKLWCVYLWHPLFMRFFCFFKEINYIFSAKNEKP